MIEWYGLADLGCGNPTQRWIFRTEATPGGMWARWTALPRAAHSIRVKQLGDPNSRHAPMRWGSDETPLILPPGTITWDIGKELAPHELWEPLPDRRAVLLAIETEYEKWVANSWQRYG